jgi:hypothetical protein
MPGDSRLEDSQPDSVSPGTASEECPQVEVPAQEASESCEEHAARTRRRFLGLSARKLAYISPVVLLLRPRPACASRIYS